MLVADDFSSFRATVHGMLLNLGVVDVQMASNGSEVIEKCSAKRFNVILCDYDLGPGRNGQHVLEELRFRRKLASHSVFIMVSAESSRNVVMSAYDCEPDDYLMKPITGMMLQQRMQRLLLQKEVLRPVYTAMAKNDRQSATELLIDLSIAEDRYSGVAQKMLGELFLSQGELQKAEKLYTRALETRQLDWARLGLARVKHLRGELEVAGKWLDKIVEENPLFLPAYDVLADNWGKKGARDQVQNTIERAVSVSPMSILRQKRLAKVANENEDSMTAIEALRKAIKLGKLSCYGTSEDNFELARSVSNALEKDLPLPGGAVEDALEALQVAHTSFALSGRETAQLALLKGRICAAQRDLYAAQKYLLEASETLGGGELDIDIEVDKVALLFALGEREQAEEFLTYLQEKYRDDQSALEKLDKFLTEPASDLCRTLVAGINREGIDLYTAGEYDNAIECFDKARKLFPNHVGIQLNIVQSLIGKMKETPDNGDIKEKCRAVLALVDSLINENHAQYDRYTRLRRRSELYLR